MQKTKLVRVPPHVLSSVLATVLVYGLAGALCVGAGAHAATLEEAMLAESQLLQLRDAPAPTPQQVLQSLPTEFIVSGIFGSEGSYQADVVYNGLRRRVAVGDVVGPCVVSQIAGSLGAGVSLKVAPKPVGRPHTRRISMGRAKDLVDHAKAGHCPTASWTAPVQSANQSSGMAMGLPIVIPGQRKASDQVPAIVPTAFGKN